MELFIWESKILFQFQNHHSDSRNMRPGCVRTAWHCLAPAARYQCGCFCRAGGAWARGTRRLVPHAEGSCLIAQASVSIRIYSKVKVCVVRLADIRLYIQIYTYFNCSRCFRSACFRIGHAPIWDTPGGFMKDEVVSES